MSTTRNSYHTDFKIACNFEFLPDQLAVSIPKSTKHRFKNTDYSTYIGTSNYSYIISNMNILKRIAKLQRLINIIKILFKANDLIKSIYHQYSTPFYSFFNKKNVRNKIVSFIHSHSKSFNISSLTKLFHISTQTFYKWTQRKCQSSPFQKCFQRNPFQLTLTESNKIKQMLLDPAFKFWPIISIAHYAIRNSILFVQPRTWYKYARIFGITKPRPNNRRNKNKIGIRASKPNQIIHADVTIFKTTSNVKCYIYFIVDNYSRKILSAVASLKLSGQIRFQTIKDTYEQFIMPKNEDAELIVDGGTENTCDDVMDYVEQPTVSIKHIIAGQNIEFSNSIVEAVNKIMKYAYLFKEDIPDFETLLRKLPIYVEDYNNRNHCSLYGLTPNEAYNGITIDRQLLKTNIAEAKSQRLIQNRLTRCQNHD